MRSFSLYCIRSRTPSIHWRGSTPRALQLSTREYTIGAHGSIVVAAEQEVLSSQGQRPDGVLRKVVVDTEAAVIDISPKPRHQGKRILDRLDV